MKVAVLGGGPAGAFAAERLASAGAQTVLIDEKLAWEKPCGGGITYKAYSRYPFLRENFVAKKIVTETCMSAPRAGTVALKLDQPLLIYSRLDFNQMLLNRAAAAGAAVEKTRVMGIERQGTSWLVRTKNGTIDADYCVVATGARNSLRDVGTSLTPADTMSALGYYVPGTREGIDIQFLKELDGYIWVFPRCGHLSVGICGKGETAGALRTRLESYMAANGIPVKGSTFYSHLLPCLNTPAWQSNRVAGNGWLAVGDAAGLVDPITGEGLYYAIRSGDLAAQTLISGQTGTDYRRLLRRDFASDLELGSRLAKRIFHGRFMFGTVPARMVQFTRHNQMFRSVIQDLFAGTQSYLGLKERLLSNLNGSWLEIAMSFGFGRLVG